MAALLAAFERVEASRRRRVVLAGLGVVGCIAGGFAGVHIQRIATCERAGDEISQVWNEHTKASLQTALAASHTMELRLDATGGDTSVARIGAPEMRREDARTGDKLAAVAVPIAAGYWLVGLARGEKDVAYNLDLLKTRGWIDIPLQLTDGRVAKLTFEKGPPGERALADASANW